jgi:transposase-like protein
MSFKVVTEIVSGDCPSCEASTLLVNIGETNYRCVHCGNTLEQKVNGVIKYIKADKTTKLGLRSDCLDG